MNNKSNSKEIKECFMETKSAFAEVVLKFNYEQPNLKEEEMTELKKLHKIWKNNTINYDGDFINDIQEIHANICSNSTFGQSQEWQNYIKKALQYRCLLLINNTYKNSFSI
jgi:hypothetical protein